MLLKVILPGRIPQHGFIAVVEKVNRAKAIPYKEGLEWEYEAWQSISQIRTTLKAD